MFWYRTLLCVLYVNSCFLVASVYGNNEKKGDFMTAVQHAQNVMTDVRAQKYSKTLNNLPTDILQIFDEKQDAIVERASALLSSGELDDIKYYVSEPCLNHTKLFLAGLFDRATWAMKMLDAMGKPPSGLLDFHLNWIGSWEECMTVKAFGYENVPFNGKYCIPSFKITPAQSPAVAYLGASTQLAIGMCFPESCSNWDASQLAHMFAGLIPLNVTKSLTFPGVTCQERELEYTNNAVAVIVICSIFLAVMVLATAYDLYIAVFLNSKRQGYESLPTTDEKHGHTRLDLANGHAANGHVGNGHVANGHVVDETTSLFNNSYKQGIISHHSEDLKKVKSVEAESDSYKPGLLGRLLLSFSVYTNAKKILSTNQPAGTLTSVNGIRFISMTWVILGHTYAFGLQVTDNIGQYLPKVLERFSFQVISNATFAVDTFFVLSGLLVSYLSLKEMKKRNGAKKFNWLMYYFHRFWRLTPPYMLFLMFYVTLMRYWGDGPVWPQGGTEIDGCKETWWTNLLYVNNIVKTDKMCMGWSWYLANDMQFYVLSPLLLVPLYYSPLWGGIVSFAFVLMNFIVSGATSKHYSLPANMVIGDNEGASFDKLYIKPWCRIGPYVVGFVTGFLLYKTNCKIKMPKVVNIICWSVATAVATMVLYGLYTDDMSQKLGVGMSALYNATSRTAWGMCIAWVIFACATGYGGPVNTLLSWHGIIPLSRLTYCAYLVHPVVMYTYYYSRRTLMHWYDLELSYMFCGNLCISYAVAFIVSLAFESPMMGLEKVLLGRGKNS